MCHSTRLNFTKRAVRLDFRDLLKMPWVGGGRSQNDIEIVGLGDGEHHGVVDCGENKVVGRED